MYVHGGPVYLLLIFVFVLDKVIQGSVHPTTGINRIKTADYNTEFLVEFQRLLLDCTIVAA